MNVKRVLPVVAAVMLSALAVSPALASAPPDQYVSFDVTNPTIRDLRTGLTWQRRVDPKNLKTISGAIGYCDSLNLGGPPTPWRVPTYKELLTLVDEDPHYEYDPNSGESRRYIDANAFVGTPTGNFASVSVDPVNDEALTVDFGDGAAKVASPTNQFYVRCVR